MAIDYYKYNLDQSLSGTWTNLSPGPNWSVQFQLEIFQFKQGPTNAWKISVIQNLTFLDRPDFHLADYLFLFWMPFNKLWDMYSSYLFTLTTMQKNSDRQFQEQQNTSRINMSILLSIRMLWWIRWCCEKNYENGVIVFYAKISLRLCMFHIFARNSVWLCIWTKSITLN